MIALRDYQKKCIDSILLSKDRGITRPLVSLATGLGKTIVFSALAKSLNGRTLIIAHRDELICQAQAKLLFIWPEIESEIGIVKGDLHEPNKQIVIASIQSATKSGRLADLKKAGFDLCIIDEAHHSAAPTYTTLLDTLGFLSDDPRKLLLGVTATPKRGDGVGLDSVFQDIVFFRSISWGISNGYLSPLVGRRISTQVSLRGLQANAGDFVVSQLSRMINVPGRNQLIVESFIQHGEGRVKVIAFCADVQHAFDLAATFCDAKIPSAAIHGKMTLEERRRTLDLFDQGKIRVLTNCGVLTEGFDSPAIDAVLLCRPTQSSSLYVQCVGRGTRVSPNKKDCLVMDFVDASRLGLCNFQNSLEGAVYEYVEKLEREELAVKIFEPDPQINGTFETTEVQEIDFFGRSDFSWLQVGDSWHLPIANDKNIWVHRVSDKGYKTILFEGCVARALSDRELPLDYSIGMAEDWVRREKVDSLARKDARWRQDQPSEKQLAALAMFGIENSNLTKGEASDILRIKFNEKRGLAKARA